jgi:hypothetical protein
VGQDDLSGIKRRLRTAEHDARAARVLAGATDRNATDVKAALIDLKSR